MITFKIVRFIHLLFYFMVAVQLTYYVYLMGDALRQVNISSFLDERRIVHPMVMKKHQVVYYITLFLSFVMMIWAFRHGRFIGVVSTIAFICLATEVGIALKGNGPLNELVQQFSQTDTSRDWETVRKEWIDLIKLRGYIILVGIISLFAGLVFNK